MFSVQMAPESSLIGRESPPPEEPAGNGLTPQLPPPEALAGACQGAVCPTISSVHLPAPCVGLGYSEQLGATPGAPSDYTWSLGSAPLPGLTLSPTGLLSGVPSAGGPLTVVATNASGQPATARLDLTARRSCWLAHLSSESSDAASVRLHFRDVFARQRDISLPAGAGAASVLDFEFSPDGQWLAFRAGPTDQARLHLFSISAQPWAAEQPLESRELDLRCGAAGTACSVLGFAWSKDSHRLALALHHPSEDSDYLSGADVAAPEELWAGAGIDQTIGLPIHYASGLTWIGAQRVAFVGRDPLSSEEQALYHAVLASTQRSFENPTLMLTVAGTTLTLRSSAPGLIVLNPEADARYVDLEHDAVLYHAGAWLSPSGRFFAKTTDAAVLQLYTANNPDKPVATLEGAPCASVVAWSLEHDQRESIACSAARPGPGGALEPTGQDLTLVDLVVSPEPRFAEPFRVLESADYTAAPLAGARRLFSDSASWLIVAAPSYDALVIDRSQPAPRPSFLGIPIAATAEAEIAPNGASVLVYDDLVTLYPLAHSYARSLSALADGSSVATPIDRFVCQESTQLLPERWCGQPHSPSHFQWAPDSASILFEDAGGGLWISEATAPADPTALSEAAPRQLATYMPRPLPGRSSRSYAFRP